MGKAYGGKSQEVECPTWLCAKKSPSDQKQAEESSQKI